MKSIERDRGQELGPRRSIARGFSGTDPLAKIVAEAELGEDAICPECLVLARLIKPNPLAIQTNMELTNLVPCWGEKSTLAQAMCILCTTSAYSAFRSREVHAGHIWFMIGEGQVIPQQEVNREIWRAIRGITPVQRGAMRRNLLTLAASDTFGRLRLAHEVITEDERKWFMDRLMKNIGTDGPALMSKDALNAVLAQFGVAWLLQDRLPSPEWKDRVRLIPTPAGVEAYRAKYAAVQQAS